MCRKKYFKNIQEIGDLDIIYIFFEDNHPILFLCQSEQNETDYVYLCQCYEYRNVQKWHLAKIEWSYIRSMAKGSISVYEALVEKAQKLWNIVYTKDGIETVTKIERSQMEEVDLPDKDFYLDEDDLAEFEESFPDTVNKETQSILFSNEMEIITSTKGTLITKKTEHSSVDLNNEMAKDIYRTESEGKSLSNQVNDWQYLQKGLYAA